VTAHAQKTHVCSKTDPKLILTARSVELVYHISRGKSAREISGELGISPNTVYEHVTAVRLKLKAHNIPDLVRLSIRHGFIEA